MSFLEAVPFIPWQRDRAVYSIHNADTDQVLTQEHDVLGDHILCLLPDEPGLPITKSNQLWLINPVNTNDEWALINVNASQFITAPIVDGFVVPDSGRSDRRPEARWRIGSVNGDGDLLTMFFNVEHPESCLEVEDIAVKISPRKADNNGQTWYLKKQDIVARRFFPQLGTY